jgi:hypothetical protein
LPCIFDDPGLARPVGNSSSSGEWLSAGCLATSTARAVHDAVGASIVVLCNGLPGPIRFNLVIFNLAWPVIMSPM